MNENSKKYYCDSCHYNTSRLFNYNKHLLTPKHQTATNNTIVAITGNSQNDENSKTIFYCNVCNFQCKHKSNYETHLYTEKHKKNCILVNEGEPKRNKNICSQCNKEYSNYNALWKHKKKCIPVNNEREPTELQNVFTPSNCISQPSFSATDLFLEVLKESKELQQVLIEQNKELQNKLLEKDNILIEQNKDLQNKLLEQNNKIIELASKQGSNTINSHNKTNNNHFNLQFYLNETCKDAMNIADFVNSLELTTDDFETTGKLGFIDGISRIFIKELKKLDTEKLPIHCTDFKRETVYIKDNDIWEKENDEKKRVKWAIDKIAKLNYNQIQQWQEKFPECRENNTPANEYFFRLVKTALGGYGKEEQDKFSEKIMRNVLKEVVLDKK
jgi:hypothetical protein